MQNIRGSRHQGINARNGVKSPRLRSGQVRNLTNAAKEANGIILLRLGETETKRKGETVASSTKKSNPI